MIREMPPNFSMMKELLTESLEVIESMENKTRFRVNDVAELDFAFCAVDEVIEKLQKVSHPLGHWLDRKEKKLSIG